MTMMLNIIGKFGEKLENEDKQEKGDKRNIEGITYFINIDGIKDMNK